MLHLNMVDRMMRKARSLYNYITQAPPNTFVLLETAAGARAGFWVKGNYIEIDNNSILVYAIQNGIVPDEGVMDGVNVNFVTFTNEGRSRNHNQSSQAHVMWYTNSLETTGGTLMDFLTLLLKHGYVLQKNDPLSNLIRVRVRVRVKKIN